MSKDSSTVQIEVVKDAPCNKGSDVSAFVCRGSGDVLYGFGLWWSAGTGQRLLASPIYLICIKWGFVVMGVICAFGHFSRCHFNPAITFTFSFFWQLPWKEIGYSAPIALGPTVAQNGFIAGPISGASMNPWDIRPCNCIWKIPGIVVGLHFWAILGLLLWCPCVQSYETHCQIPPRDHQEPIISEEHRSWTQRFFE